MSKTPPRRPRAAHPLVFALLLISSLALVQCGSDKDGGLANDPPDTNTIEAINAFPALSFDDPVFITHAPGDAARVFVVTQGGVIYVINNSEMAASPPQAFLDISARVTDDAGEQGLLGLAFDPGYADNGYFYVNYNPNFDIGTARRTLVSRFKVTANPVVADPESETQLLEFEQPFANHKGGWLDFGPDGKLYIANGDGGGGGDPDNRAQNLNLVLGKILRINADGSIPADNPYFGQEGKRGEIWAYGFRNPYRASFDPATGKLWAGDVGQDEWEEIDVVTRGDNYGWRKFEGSHVFNANDPDPGNTIAPVFEYDHGGGRCSVIGGHVYRGSALAEDFDGVYLYADFCSRELWGLTRDNDGVATSTLLGHVPGNPSSIGEDADGEIYITSLDGKIYKLVLAPK